MKREASVAQRDTEDDSPDEPDALAREGESLLEAILAEAPHQMPPCIEGVVIGTLLGVGPHGEPLVDFDANAATDGVAARSMVPVVPADVGREVALLFEGGNPARPVLMGFMFNPGPAQASVPAAQPEAERDGQRIVFEADREIVLKCGDSSITLTRAGKILIKGAYVLTRSSGVNRIQGGSVQIN